MDGLVTQHGAQKGPAFSSNFAESSSALPAPQAQNDFDIDSDDELMAQHSVRRGLMEQHSVAKTLFSDPQINFGYPQLRDRLMMPTELSKWSRDQRKQDQRAKQLYEHDNERLAELYEFVVSGGAVEQRELFDQVFGWSQDQAIPGRDDSLELLQQLQKPMIEVSLMNSAFSALEQHLLESNTILSDTIAEVKQELDKEVHQRWIPELQSSIPTTDEFNHALSATERMQLGLSRETTWSSVSGFQIHHGTFQQALVPPNSDASPSIVSVAPQSASVPKPPLSTTSIPPFTDIHDAVQLSVSDSDPLAAGYFSAEEEPL